MNRRTFQERCEEAYKASAEAAHPFVASIAECQEALEPLISDMIKMSDAEVRAYVHASFKVEGLMPMAIQMYKLKARP
jgi:hypothetical protein